MSLIKVSLCSNKDWIKIKEDSDWKIVLMDKTILFKCLGDYILDETNLYYYATQKSNSRTFAAAKRAAKNAIKNNTIRESIKSILEKIGFTEDSITINNKITYGDIAEYLMCILIDKFCDPETMICKVSLKTSPRVSSFGNDNLFYDYHKKILYFGESKFHNKTIQAINRACKSLDLHEDEEMSFITNSTNEIIGANHVKVKILEKKFNKLPLKDITINRIIFAVVEDKYRKEELERVLDSKKDKIIKNTIIVLLPILSKTEFLEYLNSRVVSYGK